MCGVVPSYSVMGCAALGTITVGPEKNGPLIEIGLPLTSFSTFAKGPKPGPGFDRRNTPAASLNDDPTYSGYSSEPKIQSNATPSAPAPSVNWMVILTVSLGLLGAVRLPHRGSDGLPKPPDVLPLL